MWIFKLKVFFQIFLDLSHCAAFPWKSVHGFLGHWKFLEIATQCRDMGILDLHPCSGFSSISALRGGNSNITPMTPKIWSSQANFQGSTLSAAGSEGEMVWKGGHTFSTLHLLIKVTHSLNSLGKPQIRAESGHEVPRFDQFHACLECAHNLLETFPDIFLRNFRNGTNFLWNE